MNQPEFPTVFRGYDPVQVDAHVAALHQAVASAQREAEAARQEAAEGSVQLTKVRQEHEAAAGELEGNRSRLADLENEARKASTPTFADLGERIGRILGLADEEAGTMRQTATSEADDIRSSASDEAQLTRAEADRYAEEVRNRADTEGAEVLARAKAEADSIVDDAAREAAARREEAEAYFEQQRATAAAQAADFEATLGDRREKAAAEFNEQMAGQDEALRAVQERSDLLAREAEDDHRAKTGEAGRLLESARSEAEAIVRSAREHGDRIRRDSERELAAATARRDSITAQLSNVRNMLATLGGPAAVAAVTQDAPAADEQPTAQEDQVHDVPEDDQLEEQGDGEDPVVEESATGESATEESVVAESAPEEEPAPVESTDEQPGEDAETTEHDEQVYEEHDTAEPEQGPQQPARTPRRTGARR